jgi:hypothetical protein
VSTEAEKRWEDDFNTLLARAGAEHIPVGFLEWIFRYMIQLYEIERAQHAKEQIDKRSKKKLAAKRKARQ